MTTEEEVAEANEVRKTSLLIANVLSDADVPFGTALSALTVLLVKAAIECEIDRYTLLSKMEAATKMIYEHESDKLTGSDYVQ
jgi:hypothetical protein